MWLCIAGARGRVVTRAYSSVKEAARVCVPAAETRVHHRMVCVCELWGPERGPRNATHADFGVATHRAERSHAMFVVWGAAALCIKPYGRTVEPRTANAGTATAPVRSRSRTRRSRHGGTPAARARTRGSLRLPAPVPQLPQAHGGPHSVLILGGCPRLFLAVAGCAMSFERLLLSRSATLSTCM